MGQISIRAAKADDLAGILEIYNYEIAHGTAVYHYDLWALEQIRNWWTAKVDKGFPVLIAEDQNYNLLGYGTYDYFRPYRGFNSTVEHTVYCAHNCRGMGAGSLLMKYLIAAAQNQEKALIIACIDGENQKSIDFHLGFGFEQCGYIPKIAEKFDRMLDLVILRKEL